MRTRIVIVRHTETIGNIEKRLTGRQDYELTKSGKEKICKLTEELKNIKFSKMYSSTAKRALKTIQPLAEINDLIIQELEELSEMYFGEYDGWKWEDVNKIHPEIKDNQNKINEIYGIPGQETMEEVAERMYNIMEKLAKENIGETILIASHGVAIEAFLRKILKKKFSEEREKFCQYNVAINELYYENGKFYVTRMADISYLDRKED